MLEAKDLRVYYEKAEILSGINLRVDEGDLVAIIGPNGAGKTTLLRAISGLAKIKMGTITFSKERIDNLSPHEIVKRGVIHCPERRMLFSTMSVMENLEMGAYLRKDKKGVADTIRRVFELFPALKGKEKRTVETLSGGEQQMVAIARSLMSAPRLLMLDEPSLGLAPKFKESLAGAINLISRDGGTILLVEQDTRFAFSIANRAYILENGKIAFEGSVEDLRGKNHVKEVYLGLA